MFPKSEIKIKLKIHLKGKKERKERHQLSEENATGTGSVKLWAHT